MSNSSKLTNEILLQIFSNIGAVVPTKVSLKSPSFKLNTTIDLEDEFNTKISLWGAEVKLDNSKLRLLLADLTEKNDLHNKEYALVVSLQDCPAYAAYLLLESTVVDKNIPRHGKIFFSLEDSNWLSTSIFLQASFLCGMEQMKEVPSVWNKMTDEQDLIEGMKLLIDKVFEIEEE